MTNNRMTQERADILYAMINSFEIARFEMEQYEEYTVEEVKIAVAIMIKRLKLEAYQ